MNPRKRFFVLGLLFAISLAIGVGLFLFKLLHKQRSTYTVARAYLAAVMDGDKEAALSLYRADALCSAPYPYPSDRADVHIAMLASSEVRNITIEVESAQGVPYPPGSERAVVSFEYKVDMAWHSGAIWLVTGPPIDDKRFICHMR